MKQMTIAEIAESLYKRLGHRAFFAGSNLGGMTWGIQMKCLTREFTETDYDPNWGSTSMFGNEDGKNPVLYATWSRYGCATVSIANTDKTDSINSPCGYCFQLGNGLASANYGEDYFANEEKNTDFSVLINPTLTMQLYGYSHLFGLSVRKTFNIAL